MVFSRLKERFSKSRTNLSHKVGSALKLHSKLDDSLWEEFEEILVAADVGVESSLDIVSKLKDKSLKQKAEPKEVKNILKEVLIEELKEIKPKTFIEEKQIILVVGVNGTGKTTSIAKLANHAIKNDKKVLLCAGDTFRAAAIEQLTLWSERLGCDIVSHERGSDSASVIFDSIKAAQSRNIDVVIADTAGRLHTQANLMEELKKINRIAKNEAGDFKVVVLLVLDANIGQNAIIQATTFNESLDVDEILLTKLDSTAKGGIIFPIVKETKIPIGFVGYGEAIDDISEFLAEDFVNALVGE